MSNRSLLVLFVALLVGGSVAAGVHSAQPAQANGGCDPSYVVFSDGVVTVLPTLLDDTVNIQCALDEATADSTVRLVEASYRTGLVEVNGFVGTLAGAGKRNTVIRSLPDLACAEMALADKFPALFTFRGGDLHLADLSFDITEERPCGEWVLPRQGFPRYDLGAVVLIGGQPFADSSCDLAADPGSASIDNVGFHGLPVDFVNFDIPVDNFVVIGGHLGMHDPCMALMKPLTGQFTIRDSTFENALNGVNAIVDDSTLEIGYPGAGNSFNGVGVGIYAFDSTRSSIRITHNKVTDAHFFGVYLQQGQMFLQNPANPLPGLSDFVVSHNFVHGVDIADGIGIDDWTHAFTGEKSADVAVTNNTIDLDNAWGGVSGFGAQDVIVSNNRITGTSFLGIYFGFWGFVPVQETGWVLQGNNLQGLDAAAPILLGEFSEDSTVIGRARAGVFDLGTNNTLVGVNNMGGNPPGPAVSQAMEQKRDLLNLWR